MTADCEDCAESLNQARARMERHINTFALAVILAVITWVGSTVVQVDKRTAVIDEAIRSLKEQSATYYPATTAARDHADVSTRLDRMEARLDQIEYRAQAAVDRAKDDAAP